MSREREKGGPSTRAVHGGERDTRVRVTDSLTTPIVQTAAFWFRDTQEVIAYQEGRHPSFEYGRYGNPTTRAVETKLLALVPRNGHVVTTHDCYRRTRQFMQTVLPKMGVRCTVIDPADLAALERAV